MAIGMKRWIVPSLSLLRKLTSSLLLFLCVFRKELSEHTLVVARERGTG